MSTTLPRTLSALSMVLLLALLACDRGERTLRDTEGRTFTARCETGGACEVVQKSGPKRNQKTVPVLTLDGGRLISVCDAAPGEKVAGAYDCRPLRCNSDAECPPTHGMSDGQCLNGWCADPSADVTVADSVMLCLGGTGLGRETATQVERYALGLNCGTPCRIPAPCLQL